MRNQQGRRQIKADDEVALVEVKALFCHGRADECIDGARLELLQRPVLGLATHTKV